MAQPPKIKVMISSRCGDRIDFRGSPLPLSSVRLELKEELEALTLLGTSLFDVWINEDAPPAEGTVDAWDECMSQVDRADVVLALYNGNAGWAKEGGDIGICHAELQVALSKAAAKVRVIRLPLCPMGEGPELSRNRRFRDFVENHSPSWGAEAITGEQVKERCRQALRDAVGRLVRLGVREARRGKYHTGDALAWHRLDFPNRRRVMQESAHSMLGERTGAVRLNGTGVVVKIAGRSVLTICHGIPDALSVPAALESVGQPFLTDHRHASLLTGMRVGPVHLLACHQGVTIAQARRLLGFPDATIVQAPFGLFVADPIQKIQLVLIAQCRDETASRHGIQRFFDWLEQAGEARSLADRAAARKRIVLAIAKECSIES